MSLVRELVFIVGTPGIGGWLLVLVGAVWVFYRFRVPIKAPRIDPNDPTPYGRL